MKRILLILTVSISFICLGTILINQIDLSKQSAQAQEIDVANQNIVNDVVEGLKQQGVPIKSFELENNTICDPPIIAKFILQSSSENDVSLPDDAINIQLISRAVNFAQQGGLTIGAFGITLLNKNNKVILQDMEATARFKELSSQFNPPLKLNDEMVYDFLNKSVLLSDVSMNSLKISQDLNGFRFITFNLQISDISNINNIFTNSLQEINEKTIDLNQNQSTQIGIYRIKLMDQTGKLLIDYLNDLQLKNQRWWQDDQLIGNSLEPLPYN